MGLDQQRIASIVRKLVTDCLGEGEPSVTGSPLDMFHSDTAARLKREIVSNGRKLWERQYVDGNGGNISARLSRDYVLCTPTLLSKGDVTVEDIVMVDLQNELICGNRPQTSEIRLHLEIYKAVPDASAVIHCHPPYATAHAVAGVIPQPNLVPEQEVFIGPVALTPYETPGTDAFARTILPVVRQHNSILLANHGIVCWADTVTHAEWYVEVLDTYCKTVMIANQLKSPLQEIPPDKIRDLLALKQKLGLPDERLACGGDGKLAQDAPMNQRMPSVVGNGARGDSSARVDQLVESITQQIIHVREGRG